MAEFSIRLKNQFREALIDIPFSAITGSLCGYLYATMADLPTHQVARAWAIWCVAENVFKIIAGVFTTNQTLIRTIVSTITMTYGIHEFRKRAFIDNKMTIFLVVCQIIAIVNDVFKTKSPNCQNLDV